MTARSIDDHSTLDGHCMIGPGLLEVRKLEEWPKAMLPARKSVSKSTSTSFGNMRRYAEKKVQERSTRPKSRQVFIYTHDQLYACDSIKRLYNLVLSSAGTSHRQDRPALPPDHRVIRLARGPFRGIIDEKAAISS